MVKYMRVMRIKPGTHLSLRYDDTRRIIWLTDAEAIREGESVVVGKSAVADQPGLLGSSLRQQQWATFSSENC
jgi:hypothetical protein